MGEDGVKADGWQRQPLVVNSTDDPAGRTIHHHLLQLGRWEAGELGGRPFWVGGGLNLLGVDGRLVDQDGLDRWALGRGLQPPLIVFASRHRSPDGRAVLTAHHTGNPGAAELGGKPSELARPAPAALKAIYLALARHCPPGFQVTLEATHHGPSGLDVPSLFVEIGSGPAQWELPAPGKAVARSIMEAVTTAEAAVALVSFGGTHYAQRQNRIIAETAATFGHIFADHSLACLDNAMVHRALELSGTRLAHLDRKALAAAERVRLLGLLDGCGATVVGEGELRRRWPLETVRCPLKAAHPSTPEGHRVDVSPSMAQALEGCVCPASGAAVIGDPGPGGAGCPRIEEFGLDADAVWLCLRLDRSATVGVLSRLPLAYHLPSRANDAPRAWAVAGDRGTARQLADELLLVLSARGVLHFRRDDGELLLTERKFDPDRARSLGVPPGPLFARLAAGEAVTVDGRQVLARDVLREQVTRIRLHHFANAASAMLGDWVV